MFTGGIVAGVAEFLADLSKRGRAVVLPLMPDHERKDRFLSFGEIGGHGVIGVQLDTSVKLWTTKASKRLIGRLLEVGNVGRYPTAADLSHCHHAGTVVHCPAPVCANPSQLAPKRRSVI